MPFTAYADGTVIFAAQLNADNATSLDLNTASPQTVQGPLTIAAQLTSGAHIVQGTLSMQGGTINNVKLVSSGVSYAMLSSDRYIFCQTGAAITVSLMNSPTLGRTITIKDSGGSAGSGQITITPATGLIDGLSSYIINANYGTVTLIYSGSKWVSVNG